MFAVAAVSAAHQRRASIQHHPHQGFIVSHGGCHCRPVRGRKRRYRTEKKKVAKINWSALFGGMRKHKVLPDEAFDASDLEYSDASLNSSDVTFLNWLRSVLCGSEDHAPPKVTDNLSSPLPTRIIRISPDDEVDDSVTDGSNGNGSHLHQETF